MTRLVPGRPDLPFYLVPRQVGPGQWQLLHPEFGVLIDGLGTFPTPADAIRKATELASEAWRDLDEGDLPRD